MLPQSHVAYTIAALDAARDYLPELDDVDYRLIALAAMGPDLLDKPLAAAHFYKKYGSAVLFAHTLMVHALVLLLGFRYPKWRPYALAFVGHTILDRLWFFPDTWYWPFRGWKFHVWKKEGSEQEDIKLAYWYAFTQRPDLIRWELGGLLAALWFVWRHRLYQPRRLWVLISTGRVPK